MARRVPGPPQGQIRVYVPDVSGFDPCSSCKAGAPDNDCKECSGAGKVQWSNRDDPSPVRAHIRNPTEGEKRNVHRASLGHADYKDGKVSRVDLSDGKDYQETAVEDFVVRVDNYSAPDGTPITNGKELVDWGEDEIVFDVALDVMTAFSLTEEQKKSSAESSGSMQSKTPPLVGTAPGAEEPDSTSTATATAEGPASNTLPSTGSSA